MTLSLRLLCVIAVSWLVTGCHPVTVAIPSRPTTLPPSPILNASPALAPATSPAVVPVTKLRFEDRTPQTGIHFTYHNDEERQQFAIIEMIGGGIGALDYDGDGWLDLMFAGGGRYTADSLSGLPSALFRNRSGSFDEGRSFDDVTPSALCGPATHYSHGISVADFNEDGFPDLLVTGYGGVMVYRNQGDGTLALLAECQLSLGDAATASNIVDRLLASHPDLIAAMKVKARLQEDAGETTRAIELMERVVVAEPFDVESRHRLAVLYGAAGQVEAHATAQAEYLRVYNLHAPRRTERPSRCQS